MGSRSIQTFVVHMIAEFTCLAVLYGSQVFTKVSNAKSSISILHIAMTTFRNLLILFNNNTIREFNKLGVQTCNQLTLSCIILIHVVNKLSTKIRFDNLEKCPSNLVKSCLQSRLKQERSIRF